MTTTFARMTALLQISTVLFVAHTAYSTRASTLFQTGLDFEDSLLPTDNGWQNWNTFNGSAQIVNDNGPSSDGSRALEVSGFSQIGWAFDLEGLVPIESGWTLEADVKGLSSSGGQSTFAVAGIERRAAGNGTQASAFRIDFNVWATYGLRRAPGSTIIEVIVNDIVRETFPATDFLNQDKFSSRNWIGFGLSNNGQSFAARFDNITFKEVPEPSSGFLLSATLVALSTLRSLRRTG